MKSSFKLLAVGAFVVAGLAVGSGTAHALNNDPTASLCAQIQQAAAEEGETVAVEQAEEWDVFGCAENPVGCAAIQQAAAEEGETVAQEEAEGEFNVTGCSGVVDGDGDDDGTPAGAGPSAALCASIKLQAPNEGHSFYEEMIEWGETGCPGADTPAGRTAVLGASAAPRGVSLAAAPLTQTVLSASVTPKASTSRLPVTGGDIAGLLTVALAGLAVGGGLLLVDKRRRSNAA